MNTIDRALETLRVCEPRGIVGSVTSLRGLTLLVRDLPVVIGSVVDIACASGNRPAEVVGFEGREAIVMMLGQTTGVRVGDRVLARQASPTVRVGAGLLGRVINGLGEVIDGKGEPERCSARAVSPEPISSLRRRRITEVLETGVRALDGFATVGRGQRVGIFAGPGVGKSTLLAMACRRAKSDVNVVALIGERGREVREFIEDVLGEEGLARSVVVVSTSDESPLMRVRAAMVASSVAEHFRDAGDDVLLVLDSLTRFAHAQRQIGLAVGEPPASKGYTPTVFARLPELLERAGAVESEDGGGGSITGIYTILVEGDDMTEPVSDAVRGILDGHVILSRRLGQQAHFPAIDVLDSVSRLAPVLCAPEHESARRVVVRLLAAYARSEDLIQIGAYATGADPETDVAIELRADINAVLRQGIDESTSMDACVGALVSIAARAEGLLASASARSNARSMNLGS